MKNQNTIFIAVISCAIGFMSAYLFMNRYEPMSFNGIGGRIDKLTGKGCVFIGGKGIAIDDVKEFYGVYPCE